MEHLFNHLGSVCPIGPSVLEPKPLSPELKAHLRSILVSQSFAKGEFVLVPGQISKHVYFIMQGLLRCFYVKRDSKRVNKEVNRWFMTEGNVVFSISSFYQQSKTREYIQALEPTFVYYITYEQLDHIYATFPEFERIGRLLTINYHLLWDAQLEGILMNNPQERYKWLIEHHPDIVQRVSDFHLASFLGISHITLSLNKWKK